MMVPPSSPSEPGDDFVSMSRLSNGSPLAFAVFAKLEKLALPAVVEN